LGIARINFCAGGMIGNGEQGAIGLTEPHCPQLSHIPFPQNLPLQQKDSLHLNPRP
jgi:hypothetical protein